MKFNAYGRRIEVIQMGGGWVTFYLGAEGKKRTAHDIVIPGDVEEAEIKNYLEDLLHELATPANNKIQVIK